MLRSVCCFRILGNRSTTWLGFFFWGKDHSSSPSPPISSQIFRDTANELSIRNINDSVLFSPREFRHCGRVDSLDRTVNGFHVCSQLHAAELTTRCPINANSALASSCWDAMQLDHGPPFLGVVRVRDAKRVTPCGSYRIVWDN
jgi:hypothetical protein